MATAIRRRPPNRRLYLPHPQPSHPDDLCAAPGSDRRRRSARDAPHGLRPCPPLSCEEGCGPSTGIASRPFNSGRNLPLM